MMCGSLLVNLCVVVDLLVCTLKQQGRWFVLSVFFSFAVSGQTQRDVNVEYFTRSAII